ncbi:Solute carrier family 26 member 9 [Pteropus alecto]|uniref:Solute carrier family 26 member 9 n=1 Tax=Pteropus alecto TaxID=9402 RepID=L5JV22_PTEAL|nr:Solute carrier family 26 member 9 [Pteropus alecto]
MPAEDRPDAHLSGVGRKITAVLEFVKQAPVDPELSSYDSEEESPSYWDLEQEMFGSMFHTETLTAL